MANTTVQTIVEAGLARCTSNDPGKLATDGELIGELNTTYQALWGVKARSSPGKHTAIAALTGVAAVYALPQNMIDMRRVQGKTGTVTAGTRINIIPVEEIDRSWHLAPRMYRRGENLVSVVGTGDPGSTDTIDLYYLDAAAALTAFSTPLDDRFDLQYQQLLKVQIAVYLSSKDQDRSDQEWQKLVEERNILLDFFLKGVGASTTALTTPTGGEIKGFLDSIYTKQKAA